MVLVFTVLLPFTGVLVFFGIVEDVAVSFFDRALDVRNRFDVGREDSSSDTDSGAARFLPFESLAGSLMINPVAGGAMVARRGLRRKGQISLEAKVRMLTVWLYARKEIRQLSLCLYLSSYHDLVSTNTATS